MGLPISGKALCSVSLCGCESMNFLFYWWNFSDVMQVVNLRKYVNERATLISNAPSVAHGVSSKWKWLIAAVFWRFYVCWWLCMHVDGCACDYDLCTAKTARWRSLGKWSLWKWRQEEARHSRNAQSRNAHTQMAFDELLFDEAYQICCDILSLLFRKYTAMHVQNGDAPGKFWLADDTRCV